MLASAKHRTVSREAVCTEGSTSRGSENRARSGNIGLGFRALETMNSNNEIMQ
jgi:hypothetical protein